MRTLAIAAVVAQCAVGVLSWGAVGHEVVTTIAQMHLHPTVLPKLCDILNYTSPDPTVPQCHLATIATWADRLRYKMRWSATMHYVGALDDYPSRTCEFPGPRGWAGHTNVLGAIRNDTTLLQRWVAAKGTTDEDDAEANEALKFLVHFLGDLHMPLHLTGRDRGGNSVQVLFGARKTNLHSLWDGLLIAQSLRTIPHNYTRPLPHTHRAIEYHLRGTIYDPLIRRIMWEGLDLEGGKWKDDVYEWLSCPAPSSGAGMAMASSSGLWNAWGITYQATKFWKLLTSSSTTMDDTDDAVLCPYAWAKPIHQLNCDIIWPKALDQPPYAREINVNGHPRHPEPELLQLDTPEYSGVIHRDWVIEKLLTQGAIRLAGVLNMLFADADESGINQKEGLRVFHAAQ